MKNLIIILLMGFSYGFPIQAKAQKTAGFTMICQFSGLPDGTKVYLSTQEKDTIAQSISKGNQFIFKGKLPKDGRFHFITVDTSVSKIASKAIFLVNAHINVSGIVGKREVTVTGSSGHKEYVDLLNSNILLKQREGEARLELHKLAKSIDTTLIDKYSLKKIELRKKIDSISKEKTDEILKWIESHPISLCAPYIILGYEMVLGENKMKQEYNRLTAIVKDSYYGTKLKERLEMKNLARNIRQGATIPNFAYINREGKKVFIHDILAKNKITLIDCWASWCKPCRSEIPKLKKIYADFKNKGFNIIGISSDQSEAAWRKALQEDETSWMHGMEEEKTVSKLFDIHSIPAYILIDGKGKMIAFDCAMSSIPRFGGSLRADALDQKIAALLGLIKSETVHN